MTKNTVKMIKGNGRATPLASDQAKWEAAGWVVDPEVKETAKSAAKDKGA